MSVSIHEQAVESVLAALEIHSPTAYSWFGLRVDDLPEATAQAMDASTARDYLIHTIQWHLYADFYCRGAATPRRDQEIWGKGPGRRLQWSPFVQSLSDANCGQGSSEPGWSFREHDNGKLVVERHGLTIWVRPTDVISEGIGDLARGAAVRVRLPNELRRLSPGFYVALGDQGLAGGSEQALVRLYWNLTDRGARLFVAKATARLNRAQVPFQLKVADAPEHFDRCDAGVLYVSKGDWSAVAPLIGPLHNELRDDLEPATPVFSKPLGPGLGLAEDPGGGESFGTSRCLLLAEALVIGHEQGCRSAADRMASVVKRFAEEGLDLDAPYLRPGSSDVYAGLWR